MGLYIRNSRYYYRKQIRGKVYYQALKLRRGQEILLSARIKQVEEEILARHFGIDYNPSRSVMFSEYIEPYLRTKAHKKSLDRDRQRLIKIGEIIGDLPLSGIGKSQVEKLERRLLSGDNPVGTTTLNRYMETLRHLFNLAIEERVITENPLRHYEPYVEEQRGRALSAGEIAAVVEAARQMSQHPRGRVHAFIYDLIVFGLNTGMRLSEILNLRKSYIVDGVIYYPLSETKSPRRRASPRKTRAKLIVLNDMAQAIVKRQRSTDDYVFALHRRDPNTIFRSVKLIRKRSGVKDFTFHMLRHTASTIIASQSSLATAKVVLGHQDLRTTLKYTHPELAEQKKTVTNLGNYIREIVGK
jgi:integrase